MSRISYTSGRESIKKRANISSASSPISVSSITGMGDIPSRIVSVSAAAEMRDNNNALKVKLKDFIVLRIQKTNVKFPGYIKICV